MSIYSDFGFAVRNRLIEDVNGKVKFETVPEADCILIYIGNG